MNSQVNAGVLRGALLSNAVFSAVCGGLVLLFPDAIVTALLHESVSAGAFSMADGAAVLGAGLVAFAAMLAFTASRLHVSEGVVVAICLADAAWVAGSVGVLALAKAALTPLGAWTVGVVAVAVASFGLAQIIGLAIAYRGKARIFVAKAGPDRLLMASRDMNATADRAWRVMTDHESYAEVADNIAKVEVLGREGAGMQRQCTGARGEVWREQAHVWQEGVRYGFMIDTPAPDYPYPLQELTAVWEVRPLDTARCRVSMQINVTPTATLKGALFIRVSMILFPRVVDRLLDGWRARMEGDRRETQAKAAPAREHGAAAGLADVTSP